MSKPKMHVVICLDNVTGKIKKVFHDDMIPCVEEYCKKKNCYSMNFSVQGSKQVTKKNIFGNHVYLTKVHNEYN